MHDQDIARLRLYHQQILKPARSEPGAVVADLCAVQAQDLAGSLWSVGLRMSSAVVTDIQKAIVDQRIIRTWLLRGTLHLVAPKDVRWILGLVGPRIIAGSAGRHRQIGLSDDDFVRSRELIAEELRGGGHLTRNEIFRVLEKAGISPAGQRGYHLLATAGLEGLICFGPPRAKQQTFVLLDEWVPEPGRIPEQKEALGWLANRYFTGHGPATLQDFVWWSGLKISDAKTGVEVAGSLLSLISAGGREYLLSSRPAGDPPEELPAYLLPGYDEYIVGYRDRSAVLESGVSFRTVIGGNGMMLPTMVIDGSVAGTWKRTVGRRGLSIELRPFSPLSTVHKTSVTAAAERYGKFMDMPAVVEW